VLFTTVNFNSIDPESNLKILNLSLVSSSKVNLLLEYPESLPGKLEFEIQALLQHGLHSLHIQSHRHEHRRRTSEESDSGSDQYTEE